MKILRHIVLVMLIFSVYTILLTSTIWSQVRYDTTNFTIISGLRGGVLKTMDDGSGRVIVDTVIPTGTVSSVAATGANGISVSGSPVTSSGTLGLSISNASIGDSSLHSTFLKPANNLTDVSSTNTSLNNLLPSQASHSSQALITNGTNTGWSAVSYSLFTQTSVNTKDTISNTSVTDTCFYATFSLGANSLAVGSRVHIHAAGFYSTALIAPTLQGKLKVGSTTVLNTGTLSSLVNSLTNVEWFADGYLVVTVSGASGRFEAHGNAFFSTAATTGLQIGMGGVSGTVDMTSSQTVAVCITWGGTVGSSDVIILRQFIATIE